MIVIDTNIAFSALLKSNSNFATALLNPTLRFVSPCNLFIEIFKHKERLTKYSKKSETEILDVLLQLLNRITFISTHALSVESIEKAYELCNDIDEADVMFVAVAIEFNASIWTGDKKLITGLTQKGFNNFFKP